MCGTKLQRILHIFDYLNVIKSPTRITKNSTSLLDLVIASPNLNCLKSGSIDLGISDHHLVYGVFALTKSKPTPKIAFVKYYKSFDLNELKADMARAPWHIIGALEGIDKSVFLWESMFKSILDNHIKKRMVKIRGKSLPWMNTEIRKAMNRRYKYLREAHVNPGNNELWCRYKQQRNKVRAMLRKAEVAYWLNLFENANSPGDFWKVTNRILKKNRIKKCGPIQDKNGNVITRSEQKADYFNDFFLNIALDLTRNLSPLPSDTTNFVYKVCPTMSSFSVEWNVVQEIVQESLNSNKAMGLDHISPRNFKLCESSVVQGLFEICIFEKQSRLSIPYELKEIPGNCSFQKGQQARRKQLWTYLTPKCSQRNSGKGGLFF